MNIIILLLRLSTIDLFSISLIFLINNNNNLFVKLEWLRLLENYLVIDLKLYIFILIFMQSIKCSKNVTQIFYLNCSTTSMIIYSVFFMLILLWSNNIMYLFWALMLFICYTAVNVDNLKNVILYLQKLN